MVHNTSAIPQPEVDNTYASSPAHMAFISTLRQLYQILRLNPEGLRWADITPNPLSGYAPNAIFTSPGEDLPSLGVEAVAMDGDRIASRAHYVPVLVRDVNRLSLSSGLREYQIRRIRGAEREQDELLSEPFSLEDLLGYYRDHAGYNLSDNTPVVDATVFLPMPSGGEFRTEFNFVIRTGDSGDYIVRYVVQDSFGNAGMYAPKGMTTRIEDYKGDKKYGFAAELFPDMSELRRLMEPADTASRMVLIALPIISIDRTSIDQEALQKWIQGLMENYKPGEQTPPTTPTPREPIQKPDSLYPYTPKSPQLLPPDHPPLFPDQSTDYRIAGDSSPNRGLRGYSTGGSPIFPSTLRVLAMAQGVGIVEKQ